MIVAIIVLLVKEAELKMGKCGVRVHLDGAFKGFDSAAEVPGARR